jgi:hypothetical protein
MEIYTEEEREYHTDIINDAINTLEKKKESFEIPVQDHIDMVIGYNCHMDMIRGTEDVYDTEEYVKLFEHSEILVRYLSEVYQKTGELNLQTYYIFCKTVQKMMEILANDTGETDIGIEQIFQKMRV